MTIDSNSINVRNNSQANRYEAEVEGRLAMIEYTLKDKTIIFTHTETPPELAGQGVASKMARFALDDARTQGYKIIPLCPFVKGYLERHEEYQPLILERQAWRDILEAVGLG